MSEYATIRAELEKKLDELTARVENIEHDLSEPGSGDWEELALEREDSEVLSTVGNLSLREMEQIKLAIHKIDAGQYGICAACGNKIAPQRLEALPFATTCIRCA